MLLINVEKLRGKELPTRKFCRFPKEFLAASYIIKIIYLGCLLTVFPPPPFVPRSHPNSNLCDPILTMLVFTVTFSEGNRTIYMTTL